MLDGTKIAGHLWKLSVRTRIVDKYWWNQTNGWINSNFTHYLTIREMHLGKSFIPFELKLSALTTRSPTPLQRTFKDKEHFILTQCGMLVWSLSKNGHYLNEIRNILKYLVSECRSIIWNDHFCYSYSSKNKNTDREGQT